MVKVTILNKDGSLDQEVEMNTSKNMLDQALDGKADILFGCFGGSCATCICSIERGEELIDKEGIRSFIYKGLKEKEFLPCIAKIKEKDVKIIS